MLTTRPATEQDQAFLRSLYGSTREEELAVTGWPDAQKQAFIDMQFDCRTRSYALQFPSAENSIIEADGLAVGAWILDRRPTEISVVDVAIRPEHRSQGLGSEMLRRVLAEAAMTGRSVGLRVDRGNQALRLYGRLGFQPTGEGDAIGMEMIWEPTTVEVPS